VLFSILFSNERGRHSFLSSTLTAQPPKARKGCLPVKPSLRRTLLNCSFPLPPPFRRLPRTPSFFVLLLVRLTSFMFLRFFFLLFWFCENRTVSTDCPRSYGRPFFLPGMVSVSVCVFLTSSVSTVKLRSWEFLLPVGCPTVVPLSCPFPPYCRRVTRLNHPPTSPLFFIVVLAMNEFSFSNDLLVVLFLHANALSLFLIPFSTP